MTSQRCTSRAVTRVSIEIDPQPLYFRNPLFDANSTIYDTIGFGEVENLMTSHPIFCDVTFSATSCPPRIYILYGVSDKRLGSFLTKIVLMTSLPVFHYVTFSALAYPYQNHHNRSRSKFRVFHQNLDYLSRNRVSFKQTFNFRLYPFHGIDGFIGSI